MTGPAIPREFGIGIVTEMNGAAGKGWLTLRNFLSEVGMALLAERQILLLSEAGLRPEQAAFPQGQMKERSDKHQNHRGDFSHSDGTP